MPINKEDLIDLEETPSNLVSISQNWFARLQTSTAKNSTILGNHFNVSTALQFADEWSNVLAFDQFSQKIIAKNSTPWGYTGKWTTVEDIKTAIWMQSKNINASPKVVAACIIQQAMERSFHPVKEYLTNLEWDEIPRLDNWLHVYLGVKKSDFTIAIASRFLISAISRIFDPGCKADCCLVLEGKQGAKKSTALDTLAHPWFTDEITDLGSKDSIMQLHGNWIIEMGELDAIRNKDVSKIKAFISRRTDKYRPPYAQHVIEVPRQCIFTGSINHREYLHDETGARRFWPVEISEINIDALKRDKDQLWAEALLAYNSKAKWWLETEELVLLAEQEQSERYDNDIWEPRVLDYLKNRKNVGLPEILENCLLVPICDQHKGHKTRVASILTHHKWERFRVTTGDREYRYRPPKPKLIHMD